MTQPRSRQPKGLRVGGQFMSGGHGAPDLALASLGFVPDAPARAEGPETRSAVDEDHAAETVPATHPDRPELGVKPGLWREDGRDRTYDDGFVRMRVVEASAPAAGGTYMTGDPFAWSVASRDGGERAFGTADSLEDAQRQAEGAWGSARWGPSGVRIGDVTPWGRADAVDDVADGITRADTAGHGGWKLSEARNRAVPLPLREESGWYEKDSAWAKAAMAFPDEPGIARINHSMRGFDDRAEADRITHAELVVRDHWPHEYERVTGRTVLPGQSLVRDREFTDQQKLEHRMRYRPVTDDDRATSRHLYEQIGPVAAGNLHARARNVVTIPHGMMLQGCRSGRRRVDVSVRDIGLGLREVTVFGSDGAKMGHATVSGQGGLQRAMLAIGDGRVERLAELDRRIR